MSVFRLIFSSYSYQMIKRRQVRKILTKSYFSEGLNYVKFSKKDTQKGLYLRNIAS